MTRLLDRLRIPRAWRRFEALLVLVLLAEIVVFSATATNFATVENFTQLVSAEAELGLLALALTMVILTGGIDLSVGSALALCAVVFGKLWRDGGLPVGLAAGCALALGLACGGVNAFFIARLRLPPLIVTLGTFSLYRGLAEGITGGSDTFSGFPAPFLHIFGQPGWRLGLFGGAMLAVWLLVHRTVFGRTFRALGFAPEGARYAGLPVRWRLGLAYLLAGGLCGLAALLNVARVNQAAANAGLGYEMFAITAVVLGGASIFGGKGSVHGAVLGFLALAILRTGLILSDLPAELAGILTGALLLLVLAAEALAKRLSQQRGSSFMKARINPLSSSSE